MTNLRAFFCCVFVLSLLPLYLTPEHGTPRASATGMDAPPPPILESSYFATGSLERRSLGGPSVTSGLWVPGWAWVSALLRPAPPDLAPPKRAELQQWRLEGG